MSVESSSACPLLVDFLTPSSQCNEECAATPRFETHATRDFIAVHLRHADIEDDHIGTYAGGTRKCFGSGESRRNVVPAKSEHGREGLRRVPVIVHDEQCCARSF